MFPKFVSGPIEAKLYKHLPAAFPRFGAKKMFSISYLGNNEFL